MRSFFLVLAFLASATVLRSQTKVWVVDDTPGTGADFAKLQPAIDAAAEGDVILVRAGSYPDGWIAIGKSLAIVGQPGAQLNYLSFFAGHLASHIRGLGPAQWFVLRGFAKPPTGSFHSPLRVEQCAGVVWVEGCDFQSEEAAFALSGLGQSRPAVEVRDSSACVLVRCKAVGTSPVFPGATMEPGTAGTSLRDSAVHLYECKSTGGTGFVGISFPPFLLPGATPGGPGVRVEGGSLFASGGEFRGGEGGEESTPTGTRNGQVGGDGLVLAGASPLVHLLDVALAGGAGGGIVPAPAGQPSVVQSGTLVALPGEARTLLTSSPVHAGDTLSFVLDGAPGDVTFLGVAPAPRALFLAPFSGTLVLGDPIAVMSTGALGPSGALLFQHGSPALGPGEEARISYFQGGFVTGAPELRLGSPSVVVLLDPAF